MAVISTSKYFNLLVCVKSWCHRCKKSYKLRTHPFYSSRNLQRFLLLAPWPFTSSEYIALTNRYFHPLSTLSWLSRPPHLSQTVIKAPLTKSIFSQWNHSLHLNPLYSFLFQTLFTLANSHFVSIIQCTDTELFVKNKLGKPIIRTRRYKHRILCLAVCISICNVSIAYTSR